MGRQYPRAVCSLCEGDARLGGWVRLAHELERERATGLSNLVRLVA